MPNLFEETQSAPSMDQALISMTTSTSTSVSIPAPEQTHMTDSASEPEAGTLQLKAKPRFASTRSTRTRDTNAKASRPP